MTTCSYYCNVVKLYICVFFFSFLLFLYFTFSCCIDLCSASAANKRTQITYFLTIENSMQCNRVFVVAIQPTFHNNARICTVALMMCRKYGEHVDAAGGGNTRHIIHPFHPGLHVLLLQLVF